MELTVKQCLMLFCVVLQFISSTLADDMKYRDGSDIGKANDEAEMAKRQDPMSSELAEILRKGGMRISLRSGARPGFDRISHLSDFSSLGKRAGDGEGDLPSEGNYDAGVDMFKRGFDRINYHSNLGFGKRNGGSEYDRYRLASYLIRAIQQSQAGPFSRFARAFGHPRALRNPHKGFDRIGHSSSFSRLG